MGIFTNRFVPDRVQATPEQMTAALEAARANLPALQATAADAAIAWAGEAHLDAEQRRLPAHASVDMDALARASADAQAALRAAQDEVAALEAAIPVALDRQRREAAAATVTAFNRDLGHRKDKLGKGSPALVREAQHLATALIHVQDRRRSLLKAAAELGVSIGAADVDSFIREAVAAILAKGSPNFDSLEHQTKSEVDRAKRRLDDTPFRTTEDELADMAADDAWHARVARREAEQAAAYEARLRADAEAANADLPEGMYRRSVMDHAASGIAPAPTNHGPIHSAPASAPAWTGNEQ